jgi:hypothetical protein
MISPFVITVLAQQEIELGVSWTHEEVRDFSNWIQLTPIEWDDVTTSPIQINTADQSVKVGDNPRTNFVIDSLTKKNEEFLGSYQLTDGRSLVLNEYTFEVGVGAITDTNFQDYFGSNADSGKFHQDESYKVNIFGDARVSGSAVLTSEDSYGRGRGTGHLEVFDAMYSGRTVSVFGYNVDQNRYSTVGGLSSEGLLRCRIDIDPNVWQSIFPDINGIDSNYIFTDEVYSRVVQVQSLTTSSGDLNEGNQLYDIISQSSTNIEEEQNQDLNGVGVVTEYHQTPFPVYDSKYAQYSDRVIIPWMTSYSQDTMDDGSRAFIYKKENFIIYTHQAGYIEEDSGDYDVISNTQITQGGTVEVYLDMKRPDTNIVISSNNLDAYDKDIGIVEDADFEVPFKLRPHTEMKRYRHVWRYSENNIEHYLYNIQTITGGSRSTYAWRYRSPGINEVREKIMVSAWSLKNVFAFSKFDVKIQIGAFYDPQPIRAPPEQVEDPEPTDTRTANPSFGDLNTNSGRAIFPVLPDVSAEKGEAFDLSSWFSENSWFIIISISLVGMAIILFYYRDRFIGRGETKSI